MLSAQVVCCTFDIVTGYCKYRDKQCGPRSNCFYRNSLISIYTVNDASKTFHWGRQRKTTFDVIGSLRVKLCPECSSLTCISKIVKILALRLIVNNKTHFRNEVWFGTSFSPHRQFESNLLH